MGCCQSGMLGNNPGLENHPLLGGKSHIVPPLNISDSTTHKLDEAESGRASPIPALSSKSPPSSPHQGSIPQSSSSPNLSIKNTQNESQTKVETPKSRTQIPRSLTMSASGVPISPLVDQLNQKFQRSITDLPVASDIPRMAPRTTVFDVDSNKLFNRSEGIVGLPKPQNSIELVKSFIVLLYQLYLPENPRLPAIISEKYDEILPSDFEGDTKDKLNTFLENSIGNEGPVASILKCINQGMAAPAIMSLKIGLIGKVNYKDMGNQWDIEVRVTKTGAIVSHKKREQMIPAGCDFLWQLDIEFNSFTTITKSNFSVVEINFSDEMEPEKKNKILHDMSSFLHDSLREKFNIPVSPGKSSTKSPVPMADLSSSPASK